MGGSGREIGSRRTKRCLTKNNVTLESIVIVCNWVDRLNSDKKSQIAACT